MNFEGQNPFETLLESIGFKRIEGQVFGQLSLQDEALTQEEIENLLGLSQSSVSQALKRLTHFGAIDIQEISKECSSGRAKRLKVYSVKQDGLNIVATVFRKREQPNIEEFKQAISELSKKYPTNSKTAIRLKSMILACDIAEYVMDFVINLSKKHTIDQYEGLVPKLPMMFDLLLQGSEKFEGFKNFSGVLAKKFFESSQNIFGEKQ
ncbi:MAG: hypothetical protein H6622_08785 [Halobacteriovoraceae bacterium]|nr:hypothetical protein [Halobacteriovoraceae bacterium]